MNKVIKKLLKKILPETIQDKIKHRDEYLRIISIRRALKEQGLFELYNRLSSLVPDISNQYTNSELRSEYFRIKVRAEHAFQISLVQDALRILRLGGNDSPLTIVDIGDSCGTHLQYLKHTYNNINTLSVNLDPVAVKKIKEKGMSAICARAEDLDKYSIKADIYLSFEMLEHLYDPINFLYKLSNKTKCRAFVITVPYLKQSRIGLNHIRSSQRKDRVAENTHIFELSPPDWRLLFQHSGWSIIDEKIYLQYPTKCLFRFTKSDWLRNDFEGFYGAVLSRDPSWSVLYKDWQ